MITPCMMATRAAQCTAPPKAELAGVSDILSTEREPVQNEHKLPDVVRGRDQGTAEIFEW